jgi:hypothetical protein
VPLVFDLTPNVLGPSEGFSQAGFAVQAAMGFDQEHHVTWKVGILKGNFSPTFNANTSRYDIIQIKYMIAHL